MDVTHYLNLWLTARQLAMKIILDVLDTTGITATAASAPIYTFVKLRETRAKHIQPDKTACDCRAG